MRTLPQAPNLDWLKQQAKDLLAALRETQPRSTLSDAQRVLAEQYGFRTWPELKAEVERARSEPAVFDADTAAGIAKAFDLGELTEPAILLEVGVAGPSVRLQTDRGRWHVYTVLPGSTESHAEESIRLMNAAGSAGIKTPQAVRSPAGLYIEEIDGRLWRADEWIDRGPTIASPVSSRYASKAGALLATLHGLKLEPAFPMHPWLSAQTRNADQWKEVVELLEGTDETLGAMLARSLPSILDVSAGRADPPTDGLVLSHTDFQPSSTHLDKGEALVPMGWEFAGAIPPAWHIAMVLDSWTATPDGDINEPAAKALMEGYASVADEVPALDVSAFSPVIVAWLNWLVSRIAHVVRSTDARPHAEKELAHMLAHPKDRARFERLLRAAGVAS